MSKQEQQIHRGTGLLVVEVIGSNPNGDPDRESDPRQRDNEHGEISPVSVKRKIRDLVDDKEGPVWRQVSGRFNPPLDPARFSILESRGRDRSVVVKEIGAGTFVDKYWDGRVFGNTFLEEGLSEHIRSGAVQFGLGLSVAPIQIERLTTTNKSGVQADKDRGMAPLAFRVVTHGVYVMPFFVNASNARKSGCTKQDVDVLVQVLPFTYSQTSSYVRNTVEIRHAWYVEHESPLGSASDFAIIEALKPTKRDNPDLPSSSWSDYEARTLLPEYLQSRLLPLRDLMAEAYATVGA